MSDSTDWRIVPCEGIGGELVEVEPIDQDDLDASAPDDGLYPVARTGATQ
jgi:hypothetical protein